MFILKPILPEVFTKDDIETIKEVVRDSRLVDKGIKELEKFSANAPCFDSERRKFLKHAAVLAGLIASGQLLRGLATAQEPVQFQGKTYGGWEAWLMSQDLIRGPRVLIHPSTGLPSDFEHHIKQGVSGGFGAIDYDVYIGTPIVPTANARSIGTASDRTGGLVLNLIHGIGNPDLSFISNHAHLDKYNEDATEKGTPYLSPAGFRYRAQSINKLLITGFSGNSGVGPGGGSQPHHLHFPIGEIINKKVTPPGLNPFEIGIDAEKKVGEYGGRPVYWDTKTSIQLTEKNKKIYLQKSLDTLAKRVKESDLDASTKQDILDRHNKPLELRNYLGMRVLLKKPGQDGKPQYEFPPGSLMYSLMLEFYGRTSKEGFTAMLPFIFPPLKEVYQKANPGIKF